LWEHAQAQSPGDYWQKTTFQERCINFNQPVATILRHIRAYGSTESMANLNNNWFVIKRALGWPETHTLPAGYIAHVFNRTLVVAATDGYIALVDCDMVPPHVIANALAAEKSHKPISPS
jgi:methionyl-tRNA formyltransferase